MDFIDDIIAGNGYRQFWTTTWIAIMVLYGAALMGMPFSSPTLNAYGLFMNNSFFIIEAGLFIFGVSSLIKAIYKDELSKNEFSKFPKILNVKNEKSSWIELRKQIPFFPISIVINDSGAEKELISFRDTEPKETIAKICKSFEEACLARLDEEVKVCKIKKKYRDFPETGLFKYPGETNLNSSVNTLGFCLRRRNSNYFFAKNSVEIVYFHVFKDIDAIKSILHWHKFNNSEWINPRYDISESNMASELEKIWLDSSSEFFNAPRIPNANVKNSFDGDKETSHSRGQAL